MGKQQPLSPEKYIHTRARSLPVYKCYVTARWKETMMANIAVMRRHVNGNYTVGMYLVDLLCLGIKDTFYLFNVSKEQLDERFDMDELYMEEAEYNLVHNIIYAGHDFAMDFDIKPHKDFSITKFILEDDDAVPLIEIPVGDENGNPRLLVSPSYNYAPILQKLKQHAGEGNYTFFIGDDRDEDSEFDEDDEFDEDQDEHLDFNVVKDMETEELEEIVAEQTRSFTDQFIVNSELLLRELNETENGVLEDFEFVKEKKDFRQYENRKEQWQKAYDESEAEIDRIFPTLQSLTSDENGLDDEAMMSAFLELLEKYTSNDAVSYVIVNSMPLQIILGQFRALEKSFPQHTPAVQLFIASYAMLTKQEVDPNYHFIINASSVEYAYPFNRLIHGMHHKLFWLVKAIHGIQSDDKETILHYHNLLRISGTGGNIRYLYAAQLVSWLSKYMGIEIEQEDDGDDESDSKPF